MEKLHFLEKPIQVAELLKGFKEECYDSTKKTRFKHTIFLGQRFGGNMEWLKKNSIRKWSERVNKYSNIKITRINIKGISGDPKYWQKYQMTVTMVTEGAFSAKHLHPSMQKLSGVFKEILGEELLLRFPLELEASNSSDLHFAANYNDFYLVYGDGTKKKLQGPYSYVALEENKQQILEDFMATADFKARFEKLLETFGARFVNLSCFLNFKQICLVIEWDHDIQLFVRSDFEKEFNVICNELNTVFCINPTW